MLGAGNRTYGEAAAAATRAIFARRSPTLGLPGNTVDCDSGGWVRGDSGIGAGLDSYYEYLLKVLPPPACDRPCVLPVRLWRSARSRYGLRRG